MNALVLVDADNVLLASSQGAGSAYTFAVAASKRIEELIGGRPHAQVAFLNPASHPDGLEAFTQAGFLTRATPSFTSGRRTSSADAVMMVEGLQWVFDHRPTKVVVVSADTDFVPLLRAIRSMDVEAMVLTPSAQVPKALAAAACVARPLWPANDSTQRRAATPGPRGRSRTRPNPPRARQSGSAAVRATGPAPRAVYLAVVQPLQRQGIACPAIDEDRLQRALELADVALGARDPFFDLQRLTKSENLGLRPAEVGFILSAIAEGRWCNQHRGAGSGAVRDAFASRLAAIAERAEVPPGGLAAIHDWVGSPPTSPSLFDRNEARTGAV